MRAETASPADLGHLVRRIREVHGSSMTDNGLPVELYGTRIGELEPSADGTASLRWSPDAVS